MTTNTSAAPCPPTPPVAFAPVTTPPELYAVMLENSRDADGAFLKAIVYRINDDSPPPVSRFIGCLAYDLPVKAAWEAAEQFNWMQSRMLT